MNTIVLSFLVTGLYFLAACAPTSRGAEKGEEPKQVDAENPLAKGPVQENSPGEEVVDPNVFIDLFTSAQQCLLNTTIKASPALNQQPNHEKNEKFLNAMSQKGKDKDNRQLAWKALSGGCDNNEIASIQAFFQCQNDACQKKSLKPDDEQKVCPTPETKKKCSEAFIVFIHHFIPDMRP